MFILRLTSVYWDGLSPTDAPPGPSPLQQARAPVVGNKPCSCSYSQANESITDNMICVRPEGKAACQVTLSTISFITNPPPTFNSPYSIRGRPKLSVKVLCFPRVTLEDLCSACSILSGSRPASPFSGHVVTGPITLRSIPECLNFRRGSRMKWRGLEWALKRSPPTVPTQATALCV